MSIKATVIGGPPACGFAPTRLGSPVAPEGFRPTPFFGTPVTPEPVAPVTHYAPTALKASPAPAPVPAPSPLVPVKASALPGVQRKPVEVPLADLARKFPQAGEPCLGRIQAVLAGIHPQTWDATAWIGFGLAQQDALATLVKQRLKLAQEATARSVAQHLGRLHDLLAEVLSAMDGGFLKKPAVKVWAEVEREVTQLEGLLRQAGPEMTRVLVNLGEVRAPTLACGDKLEACAYALEYLLDQLPAEVAGLAVGRLTSMTGSQAMLREHLLYLEQDLTQMQELTALVNDGVLLKLPAVYTQLAGLAAKPSETQRYLAAEKLNEILQSLTRK